MSKQNKFDPADVAQSYLMQIFNQNAEELVSKMALQNQKNASALIPALAQGVENGNAGQAQHAADTLTAIKDRFPSLKDRAFDALVGGVTNVKIGSEALVPFVENDPAYLENVLDAYVKDDGSYVFGVKPYRLIDKAISLIPNKEREACALNILDNLLDTEVSPKSVTIAKALADHIDSKDVQARASLLINAQTRTQEADSNQNSADRADQENVAYSL